MGKVLALLLIILLALASGAGYLVVLKISDVSISLKFLRLGVYCTDSWELCFQPENNL
jgi:hypothetical protein